MAGKIYKAGMSLLVIDTENKFVSTGFAKEIARVSQGASTETFFFFMHMECNKKNIVIDLILQGSIITCQMLQMLSSQLQQRKHYQL